ncbi:MAG: hypothetical protein J5504_04185 [Butyrivibrio sp.]|nr:hypothetical protein [Butyrivibrio sp.]
MDKDNSVYVAMTAGILSIILLLLAGWLLVFGNKDNNTEENEGSTQASSETDMSLESVSAASEGSSEQAEPVAVTKTVSGNSFYVTKGAVLKDVYKDVEFDVKSQLNEMSAYWVANNMAAVSELAHLDRFEAMSYSLNYINDFYYYGEIDSKGVPNGKGIAVYRDDCYYYGDWSDGVRSGTGSWVNFYPEYNNYVVTEHSYTGAWSEDLPAGEGQEHYDYNLEMMNPEDVYLQNAIGKFKDGKYDGEMYIIRIDTEGYTSEWVGICEEGKWKPVSEASNDDEGKIPVLSSKDDSDVHIYMTEEGLTDNGISGISTGGKIKEN